MGSQVCSEAAWELCTRVFYTLPPPTLYSPLACKQDPQTHPSWDVQTPFSLSPSAAITPSCQHLPPTLGSRNSHPCKPLWATGKDQARGGWVAHPALPIQTHKHHCYSPGILCKSFRRWGQGVWAAWLKQPIPLPWHMPWAWDSTDSAHVQGGLWSCKELWVVMLRPEKLGKHGCGGSQTLARRF